MASTYLTRTPASAGNRKTWTYSAWVKLSGLGTQRSILSAGNTTYYTDLRIDSSDKITFYIDDSLSYSVTTSQVLRDVSAWYHVVVAFDTTQATAADRVKIYLNGSQITSFSSTSYPALNYDGRINSTDEHSIGRRNASNNHFFESSLTHVHFIDGTAYDATAFGETDATTGIWKPKTAPSVTYGTNGFFLKFENSGAFGTDSSGNANTFTVNGTMTQTIDTPSNVFCTMNPLYENSGNVTFSNGNLTTSCSLTADDSACGTLAVTSGKWYWEAKMTSLGTGTQVFGIREYQGSNLKLNEDGTYSSGLTAGITAPSGFSQGDILSVALDLDSATKTIQFYTNGSANGDPMTLTGWDGEKFLAPFAGNDVYTMDFNFGNGYFGTTAVSSAQNPDDGIGIFEYDVPTGYRALCTKSINAEEYS